MASQQTYHKAMAAAMESASVDRAAPEDERVCFDPKRLERVVELFKEPGGTRMMKCAYRDLLHDAVLERSDMDQALALLVLRDRLTGSRDRRYVETDGGWRPVDAGPVPGRPAEEMSTDEIAESLSWVDPETYA